MVECTYDILKDVAKNQLGWRITRNENFNSEWDVFFADLGIDSEHLASMKPYQKINHFPAMYLIARKTFLGKNLKKLAKLFPEDFQFFPRTWILPQEGNDLRYYT
jgi:tubulin polyglutamylase TTLL6/13